MTHLLFVIGVILVFCKLVGVVPFATISWWIILIPFYPFLWGFMVIAGMAFVALSVGIISLIVAFIGN